MLNFIKVHWEQAFFRFVGLVFLGFSLSQLWAGEIAGTSATFAMAFFCFFYANISRFKRFKGLGFEAELWEDKKKEAEHLIERLKGVVSVYTREIVMMSVKRGRWGDGGNWRERWKVYDELVGFHSELGQEIDFSDLKKDVDAYFIFDMVLPLYEKIGKTLMDGRAKARALIKKEFGSPIKDVDGYRLRHKQLSAVPEKMDGLINIAKTDDSAAAVLEWSKSYKKMLAEDFDVTVEFDQEMIKSLEEISRLYQAGPIDVTEELLSRFDDR
ncbi:MAG: hypothetical protein ABJI96_01605 [Paracoccaceae bacterium]